MGENHETSILDTVIITLPSVGNATRPYTGSMRMDSGLMWPTNPRKKGYSPSRKGF